ncbi:aa3-type cytochrome c oxidase subunit IV [Brevundimonas sp.]|uniref:aa3-type cytochrome c oxidase subunit IV n=1 Tax=Brevundimonas sp. TaxID=1871086 RepID=UPI002FD9B680
MAASKHTDDYARGSQEISEQVSTWHLFLALAKWGSLIIGAVVLFLTLWFMPNGSFFSGFFAGAFMLAAGWFFLRSKPTSH